MDDQWTLELGGASSESSNCCASLLLATLTIVSSAFIYPNFQRQEVPCTATAYPGMAGQDSQHDEGAGHFPSVVLSELPAGCKKGTMIQPFLSDAMVVVISYPLAIIIFITFLVAN